MASCVRVVCVNGRHIQKGGSVITIMQLYWCLCFLYGRNTSMLAFSQHINYCSRYLANYVPANCVAGILKIINMQDFLCVREKVFKAGMQFGKVTKASCFK